MSLLGKLLMQKKKEYIIEYTSTDGNIVEPYSGSTSPFVDANGNNIPIISNIYKNGKGIIKLEKECYQIGYQAFSNCSSLTGLTIPDSVTTIGNQAFLDCTSLTGITIPDSVTFIGASAFNNCRGLTSITIPDSVTTINELTFFSCSSLTGITIPNSVTSIDSGAFMDCYYLSSIIVLPEIPPQISGTTFKGIVSDVKIYVPSGSVNAYKSATNWSAYADIIQAIS